MVAAVAREADNESTCLGDDNPVVAPWGQNEISRSSDDDAAAVEKSAAAAVDKSAAAAEKAATGDEVLAVEMQRTCC